MLERINLINVGCFAGSRVRVCLILDVNVDLGVRWRIESSRDLRLENSTEELLLEGHGFSKNSIYYIKIKIISIGHSGRIHLSKI